MSRPEPLPYRPTRLAGAVVLAAVAALVGACSSSGGGATGAPTSAPATQAPATEVPMSAPPATSGAASTIQVTAGTDYGSIVTGEGGRTLYLFTPDAESPGKSTCIGACAASWPPLTVASADDVTASGVTAEVGTITRDDGTLQVTLGGNPLYYFAGDAAAGDLHGQGLNNVWWVVGPDGKAITEKPGEELQY
ncbi:MAG TPA: hypothetical protein VNL94_00415 [Candidatus Binatia bacterium]|nr:hypothetical protein [Candidatus Binatia bacterium]